ncbi:MAG: hypothetical protein AAFR65_16290, partial [Pseudomonadota bacterium]
CVTAQQSGAGADHSYPVRAAHIAPHAPSFRWIVTSIHAQHKGRAPFPFWQAGGWSGRKTVRQQRHLRAAWQAYETRSLFVQLSIMGAVDFWLRRSDRRAAGL